MKGFNSQQLISIGLLCASFFCWAEPVPSGAMADFHIHCSWTTTKSEPECDDLVARLESLEWLDKEDKLALLRSRAAMASFHGEDFPKEDFCAEVRSIVNNHPDYAEALYHLAFCTDRMEVEIALLRRALEIEPDNYNALSFLVMRAHGIDGESDREIGVNSEMLAGYRESLYKATRARGAWEASKPFDSTSSSLIWGNLGSAARYIYLAAVRAGDQDAAVAVQNRVRQDMGLDELDFSAPGSCPDLWKDCRRGSGEDNFALACQPILSDIGLEGVCVSAVEELMSQAAAKGSAAPDYVLKQVKTTVYFLRKQACGKSVLIWDECHGREATETDAVARLRTALENYGGEWSSEHHRVYAQGFLGDEERLDGLRTALQVDPGNALARCELARALMARERTEEARDVLGDLDPECLENLSRGFTWVDRDDFVEWQEREWKRFRERGNLTPAAR